MSVIGFDLDGVIFRSPLYGVLKIGNIDMLLYSVFRSIPIIKKLFYKSIKIDKTVVDLLNRMSIRNDVVIISSRPKKDQELVKKILLDNKINFTKIYLKPKGISHLRFKIEKIKETGCSIYFEDKPEEARKIDAEIELIAVFLYDGKSFFLVNKAMRKIRREARSFLIRYRMRRRCLRK